MPEDLHSLRRRLQLVLPERIQSALGGYERFTSDQPPADAKGFAAWNAAAKAALAHVDLLVKLARWAEGRADESGDDDDGVETLLARARTALGEMDDDGGSDE